MNSLPAIMNETAAVFGRVSVVQIASDNSATNGRRTAMAHNDGSARRIFSSGSGTPITPVEQTNNSCGVQPSRFAASATVRKAGVTRRASGAIGIAGIHHDRTHVALRRAQVFFE